MLTEGDYRKAIDDPSYRQHFLDQVDLGVPRLRLMGRLEYKPEGIIFEDKPVAMCVYEPKVSDGKVLQTDWFAVHVTPGAFNPNFSLQEFIAQAIDHEGYHLYDFVYFPERSVYRLSRPVKETIINGKSVEEQLFRAKREVRAYTNQLEHARRNGFSDYYVSFVESQIKENSKKISGLNQLLASDVFDVDFVYEELEVIDVLPGEIYFEN